MSNYILTTPDQIMRHQMNTSVAKNLFSFKKAVRF